MTDTECRITFDAIRSLTDITAVQARWQIPVLLARIIAEAPGLRLRLDVDSDAQGLVTAAVTVIDPRTDVHDIDAFAAAEELRPVLTAIAELDPIDIRDTAAADRVWPVETTSGAIGFTTGVHGGDRPYVPGPQAGETATRSAVLADLLAQCPGHGLRIDLEPAAAADTWRMRVWVDSPAGGRASLRVRAGIRQLWPGLHLAGTPTDTVESVPALLVATADLPALLAVPVAGTDQAHGMTVGAVAPIPLTPTRTAHTGGDETGVRLGCGRTRTGHRVDVGLPVHERLRHMHIVGRTGTGKSSLLAAMATGIAAAGEGLLLLDPHGTLVDRVAHELPADALTRTWIVDSSNVDAPIPVNPLAVTDPVARERAIDEVCAMFQYLFDKRETGIVGPRFRERVAMGLRALVALHGPKASVLDVPLVLAHPDLMRKAAKDSGDARLAAWVCNEEQSTRSSEHGEVVSWVNSKFEAFSSTAALRGILGSGADAFDMATAMDEQRIILMDLSKGPLGEPASRLLAFLHLNRVWQAALRRQTTAPFTVMVDEAHSVTAGALTSMLSEGRKFGVSVVLAHQYLGQLDEDLRPAVDGNVATTVGFRGAVADLPALAARFGSAVPSETLMTLPDLSAVITRTAAAAVARPHTLEVDHNTHGPSRGPAAAGQVARARIATISALADPHRQETIPARDGCSRVTVVARDLGVEPGARPRPPIRPAPSPR
uniref:type IV secretory system conjugative DNA transfer family protein n=1 Tax=Rhodococcus sp. Q TaxID=2502252 RepID=UPI0010F9F463